MIFPKPHQLHVINDKHDLDIKLEKLEAFIASVAMNFVDRDEQQRLIRQSLVMKELSKILGERIEAFK